MQQRKLGLCRGQAGPCLRAWLNLMAHSRVREEGGCCACGPADRQPRGCAITEAEAGGLPAGCGGSLFAGGACPRGQVAYYTDLRR